jgi:cytochrome c oxidase subunit IV
LLVSGLLIFMVFSHIFKKRVKLIFAIMDFSISVFAVVLVFNFFLM